MNMPTTLVTAVVAATTTTTTTTPAIQSINPNTNTGAITDDRKPFQSDVRVQGFLCTLIPSLDVCHGPLPDPCALDPRLAICQDAALVKPSISARDMRRPSIELTMEKEVWGELKTEFGDGFEDTNITKVDQMSRRDEK
ncbi:hypothetical protein LTR70_001122 [Exophiala xenobiotica]|uniref:Uncharacterized protein n=1 Tax=Lithohypha guttulata TaxID=1690604 RepID=A0ABR0KMQ4_9EURO|nr:hypothetical protein LTR24_000688 [Lithohypha guttulata]KAK5328968.1 hypothetical protein LTR70_001122 [Exophiala xenobiotica]